MDEHRSNTTGIAYLLGGDAGAPLVMCLHGFPDGPRTWSSLAELLQGCGYRTAAPWLPGYAPSSLEGPFDAISLARRFLALADELAPEAPVHFVGHDWGAVITQALLSQEPSRVRSATILAIPHLLAFERNLRRFPKQLVRSAYMALFQVPGLSNQVVRQRNFRFVDKLWARWSPGFAPRPGHLLDVKQCLRRSMPAPLLYYRRLFPPKNNDALRSLLERGPTEVPTLYLHGERDGCVGPEIASGQEEFFNGEYASHFLKNCGHFLHLERPEEVNSRISAWLQAH